MYDDPQRAIAAVDELLNSPLISEDTKRYLINFREQLLAKLRQHPKKDAGAAD
jgi:hypothetical protein